MTVNEKLIKHRKLSDCKISKNIYLLQEMLNTFLIASIEKELEFLPITDSILVWLRKVEF